MQTWVGLLRGVNVGGNNKVPMGKLRQACQAAGLADVRSYIASGNLVFRATGTAETMSQKLQAILTEDFGITTPVLVLSGLDLRRAVAGRPIDPVEGKFLHGYLCFDTPTFDLAAYETLRISSEVLTHVAPVVWLFTPDGIGKSKLAEKLGRVIKGTDMTARNLNTLRALVEMLDDLA